MWLFYKMTLMSIFRLSLTLKRFCIVIALISRQFPCLCNVVFYEHTDSTADKCWYSVLHYCKIVYVIFYVYYLYSSSYVGCYQVFSTEQ